MTSDPENPSRDVVCRLLLGSEAFSEWARSAFLSPREKDRAVPALESLRPRPAVETIVKQVAKHYRSRTLTSAGEVLTETSPEM